MGRQDGSYAPFSKYGLNNRPCKCVKRPVKRRPTFEWGAHSRVYRCHIIKFTHEIYMRLLTNIIPINLI